MDAFGEALRGEKLFEDGLAPGALEFVAVFEGGGELVGAARHAAGVAHQVLHVALDGALGGLVDVAVGVHLFAEFLHLFLDGREEGAEGFAAGLLELFLAGLQEFVGGVLDLVFHLAHGFGELLLHRLHRRFVRLVAGGHHGVLGLFGVLHRLFNAGGDIEDGLEALPVGQQRGARQGARQDDGEHQRNHRGDQDYQRSRGHGSGITL